MKLSFFKVLLGIDVLIAAIAFVFFVWGLADQSISSENMGIWVGIWVALAVIIGGAWWLNSAGRTGLAKLLLLILAVPAILSGIFLLLFVVSDSKFI